MKNAQSQGTPLADRMRPQKLAEFVGQTHLLGKGKLLRNLIEAKSLTSMIFWGPPGVGKTTLARLIAKESDAAFVQLSAVDSGKKDLRSVLIDAVAVKKSEGKQTILFLDEVHRWNKAQQDALLPYVERGDIILIGATTENPSFEVIRALLSRCRVFILESLTPEDILILVERALEDKEQGLGNTEALLDDQVGLFLAERAGGDARVALNTLELAVRAKPKDRPILTKEDMAEALERNSLVFGKKGEEFYNLISALHKSMRGSDANAALYWLARMLEAGADPLYVARRVVRFASEDIGMANSEALVQANAAFDACHKIGMPECSVNLAQAVVYCAKSKKSNKLYVGYGRAAEDAKETSELGVPLHLRNAPTKLMKDIGYGKGYKYNPDYDVPVEQEYLPTKLKGRDYLGE